MAVDLALNILTADLVQKPTNDIEIYRGDTVTAQRIRVRLKVQVGTWLLDPSGSLGSRAYDLMRMPISRALEEIPLVVKEALAPMDDVQVIDVIAEYDEKYPKSIGFSVIYAIVDPFGNQGEPQSLIGAIPAVSSVTELYPSAGLFPSPTLFPF